MRRDVRDGGRRSAPAVVAAAIVIAPAAAMMAIPLVATPVAMAVPVTIAMPADHDRGRRCVHGRRLIDDRRRRRRRIHGRGRDVDRCRHADVDPELTPAIAAPDTSRAVIPVSSDATRKVFMGSSSGCFMCDSTITGSTGHAYFKFVRTDARNRNTERSLTSCNNRRSRGHAWPRAIILRARVRMPDEKKRHLCAALSLRGRAARRADAQRDIMFMLTLCITHSVPTIRIAAVSTV